jgi:DNA-binding MarR family transcriptional regulator
MAKTVFERADQPKDLNAQLVLSLEKMGRVIESFLWQQAKEHELSPLQIRSLLAIQYQKEGMNASQLAKQFNLSKATVSVALRPLEEKKMLTKRTSEKDSRSSSLHLTDWGKQIAHIAGFYLEPLHQVITPISNAEKEIMLRNITGIIGKLTTDE